jgi:DnaJ-domain-containing protein 1
MIFAQENTNEIDYNQIVDSVIQYHYATPEQISIEKDSDPISIFFVFLCVLIIFSSIFYLQFGPSSQWRKGKFPKRLRYNSKNLFEAYICLGIDMMKTDVNIDLRQQFKYVAAYLKNKFPGFKDNHYRHILNTVPLNIKRDTVLDWLSEKMPQQERIQIIDFLVDLIFYDHEATSNELTLLNYIAQKLNISTEEVNSILSIRFNLYEERKAYEKESQKATSRPYSGLSSAYAILGLENNAPFDQVKKAYRNLAKKFHPDLFATMGKAEQEMAHERFSQINEAYTKIEQNQN